MEEFAWRSDGRRAVQAHVQEEPRPPARANTREFLLFARFLESPPPPSSASPVVCRSRVYAEQLGEPGESNKSTGGAPPPLNEVPPDVLL